jgi:hypothetical protein
MAREDAQLAHFPRQRNEFRFTGEDGLFGTDYINVNRRHGFSLSARKTAYAIFLAFSKASSMVPTM